MDAFWLGLRLLVLLGIANAAPLLTKRALGTRWQAPLDFGARWRDGRPLLGPSKTLRGVAASVLATALVAWLLGFTPTAGVVIGLAAMLGDALASFIKRRRGIASSGRARLLYQGPEALLPMLAVQPLLDLSATVVLGVTLAFVAFERPVAWLVFRIGLRDKPY
jgi:CDP-2,3-bis-(O-geranylgeranyl)-sn-glycerol synthase